MSFNNVNVAVGGPVSNPACTYKTKILKPNLGFATQVTDTDTKYVIKWDFVLDQDVTIPAGCILEFDGGSIDNNSHTLTLAADTIIVNEKASVCTTATRPTLVHAGFQTFDKTLGKPIWFNGESWVDALGNPPDTEYQIVEPETVENNNE